MSGNIDTMPTLSVTDDPVVSQFEVLQRPGLGTLIEMATPDEADSNAALGGYGSAVDMAVKVPTLSGALVALAAGTLVWAWRQLRRRRAN
jgi:hypothetical protein